MVERKYTSVDQIPVFIKAHSLALEVYKVTADFPKPELFGIISQLRRCSLSIPSNITEGFYRNTTKELIQFLYNARGSVGEVLYFLLFSKDIQYLDGKTYQVLKNEYESVAKQLNGWIKSLKRNIK